MNKDKQGAEKKQESQERSLYLERECYRYLHLLLSVLDVRLDRRLVVTFLSLVMVILMHRHRNQGLLLSELGGYLRPAYQAPAGTKRISNLLHSKRWDAEMIETYLWMKADDRVSFLSEAGRTVLVIWDESVIEKPESLHLEGLCAVRSSKAKRLKRIKPGYFNPPGGRPICVPGYHWLQVLVMGMEGPVTVAKMRWWTTRGEQATQLRTVEGEVMDEIAQAWGQKVIHVWDRGFAGAPWLSVAFAHEVRFIMRWPKRYQLLDATGQERKAWEIVRGKRSSRRTSGRCGIIACCGMLAADVSARSGSLPRPSLIKTITTHFGWLSHVPVPAANPGTC